MEFFFRFFKRLRKPMKGVVAYFQIQEVGMTAESVTFEAEVLQRLVKLETQMEHVATKEDLKDLKIWFLVGSMSGAVALASIGILLARWFLS